MNSFRGTPPAEVAIDLELVRGLLEEQHGDLAALELRPLESGWDNAMFRLGAEWVVRLPRRRAAEQLMRNEQRWLRELAPRLSLPVPAPVRVGRPSGGYPWPWSVVPWFEGTTAEGARLAVGEGRRWARWLRSLHRQGVEADGPSPKEAPTNEFRGVALCERAEGVEERLRRLGDQIDPTVWRIWERALARDPTAERCWLHGDLHPRNVLVRDGRWAAVIDWGDLTSGDVATDLASVWLLLDDPEERRAFWSAYDPEPQQLERAQGWAVLFGAVLLDSGVVDDPRHAEVGRRALDRLLRDSE